ncbi:hypothetical protein ACN20G_10355 [Streptomyces sp. BI20]|uniref:hypothetical protein n=1 Tax=Streptomyces sp. BI20 TaxID=3403460 RepID=UPI003C73B52B
MASTASHTASPHPVPRPAPGFGPDLGPGPRLVSGSRPAPEPAPPPGAAESLVLSLRINGDLLTRLRGHAARRGMTLQDYVVGTLVRDDFDERFKTAVDETERFYGPADPEVPSGQGGRPGSLAPADPDPAPGPAAPGPAASADPAAPAPAAVARTEVDPPTGPGRP